MPVPDNQPGSWIWGALETLLLGTLWGAALIWLPFFQHEVVANALATDLIRAIIKVQGVTVAMLVVGLLLYFFWRDTDDKTSTARLQWVLALMGLLSVALIVANYKEWPLVWTAGIVMIQAGLGVYYHRVRST